MKEKDIYIQISKYFGNDAEVVRIENVSGKALADQAVMFNAMTIWIESKIQTGKSVYFRPFQVGLAQRALQYLPPYMYLCCVKESGTGLTKIYDFKQFEGLYLPTQDHVRVRVGDIEPRCLLGNLRQWLIQEHNSYVGSTYLPRS